MGIHFAAQFAKAADATVIATTSSGQKGDALKKLGAGTWVYFIAFFLLLKVWAVPCCFPMSY